MCVRLQDPLGGERAVTLVGATTADTVASLSRALAATLGRTPTGPPAATRLPVHGIWIDGRPVDASVPLVASGLRSGSVVQRKAVAPPGAERSQERTSPLVTIAWTRGPDTARTVTLPAGRWIVGRAPSADVRADDPHLAAHQGVLTIDYDARVTYCDLGIGRPARLNGEPIGDLAIAVAGDSLTVGAGALSIETEAQKDPVSSDGEPSPGRAALALSLHPTAHPWSTALHRPPRCQPPDSPAPLTVPALGDTDRALRPGVGILSAVTTLACGTVMAVVLHQLVLMIMVGVGASAAIITAAVHAVRRGRGAGRLRRRTVAELARFAEALDERRRLSEIAERSNGTSLWSCATGSRSTGVWEVRSGDTGFLTASLGIGDRRYTPAIEAGTVALPTAIADLVTAHSLLRDVPIRLTIGAGDVVGLCGERHSAVAIVRSLICQWATASGPADWALVVLTAQERGGRGQATRRWDWARWLPHHCHDVITEDDLQTVCDAAAAASRTVVVITDQATHLSTRTTALRRAMSSSAAKVCVITIADDIAALSSLCTGIIQANVDGSALWHPVGAGDGIVQRFDLVGATEATARQIAAGLADLEDPELHTVAGGDIGEVELLDLLGDNASTSALIAAQWDRGGADIAPTARIGQSSTGVIEIDLNRDGPHGLIGGTTGAGKSELLRTIIVALSTASPPEQLAFVLIDYKGGAAFDRCAALPHVAGMVTDLDEHLAQRVLRSLDAEIRRRERILRDAGVADLGQYRSVAARSGDPRRPSLSRLVIVVDEFATMAGELPGFLTSLVGVAQRGRSLGMHLLLATQRPAGVVSDDIRANTNMRIALRVHDSADSTDVIGDPSAAALPRRRPGRAVIRLGADELETFQTARCTGPAPPAEAAGLRVVDEHDHDERDHDHDHDHDHDLHDDDSTTGGQATSLDIAVCRIRDAARRRDRQPPHRPWLDPLPDLLPRSELGGEGVGIVDLPDDQRRGVLTWRPADGHLVIAGVLGSGATTTLVSVVLDAAERAGPSALHIYVIDAAGSAALDPLADLVHCAGVVRVSQSERRARLLDRLRRLTVARAAGGAADVDERVILVIDGLGALRSQLLEASRPDELVDLDRIIADGPSAGITLAVSVDGAGGIPSSLGSRLAGRWVLRLNDAGEAAAFGVPRGSWPTRMPPGRGVVGGSGSEFQIGIDTRPVADVVASINAAHPPSGAPRPIEVLPSKIDVAQIPRRSPHRGPGVRLDFGLRADDLGAATLSLFDGEHACIAGASRSGRTTALVTIAASWRAQFPEGELTVIAPRSLDRFVAGGVIAADDGSHDARRVVQAVADSLAWSPGEGSASSAAGSAAESSERAGMIIVDDVDLVEDVEGFLHAAVGSNHRGLHIVVGGRIETLRNYAHWCSGIKRSRKGLLLGALSDVDGDMLGVFLPRHNGTMPLAGRGFLVSDGRADLVHVAETAPVMLSSKAGCVVVQG